MNKHIIIGNLTRDPVSGTTRNGTNYCRFTVAVNGTKKDDPAEFIEVTAWTSLGDTCRQFLAKGRKVCVVGRSHSHVWTGNDGQAKGNIQMDAESVEFLSPKGVTEDVPAEPAAAPVGPVDPQSGMRQVETDELPF